MIIDCVHYRPWTRDGGQCAAGLYGGKPSHGTCGQCKQRNLPIEQIVPDQFRTTVHKLNPDGSRCATCAPVIVTHRSTPADWSGRSPPVAIPEA